MSLLILLITGVIVSFYETGGMCWLAIDTIVSMISAIARIINHDFTIQLMK